MSDFKKLNVWQKAHELTLCLYPATASFRQTELSQQLDRRAEGLVGAPLVAEL